MRNKIVIGVMGVLLSCGVLAQAVPITIQITGNVTSASGSALPDTIYENVSFTGTYTYDSSTDSSDGHYVYNAPYGITISLGGYEFKTAPNHVGQFEMFIGNDLAGNGVLDFYSVRSEHENVSVPSDGFTVRYIRWDLWDSAHTALSSDALPVTAPVLTDWNHNVLDIHMFDSLGYGIAIYGTVTQAVLVPEPLTGVLMITGVFLLRRRR